MADEGKAAPGADDDGLVVEPLDELDVARQPASGARRSIHAIAAHAHWGRRISGRGRLSRGALIVILIAATLFALLGGPALMVAGWQRLAFALHSGTLAPRLALTGWQSVTPPPGVASDALTYTADPVAPAITFACQADASGVAVWRTDTLGHRWTHIDVSQTPAQSCQVKIALDSSLRLLLVARAPDPTRSGCERMALYLSSLSGYDWTPISQPPEAAGAASCQSDAWASARWVFAWWTDAAQPEPATYLMRSDDEGATWQNADGGLPARGAYLAPALTSYGSGDALLAQVYYWPRHGRLNILRQVARSVDDGATWETLSSGPPGAVLTASLEPRVATVGAWSAIYAPIYTDGQLSPLWAPDQAPEGIQALSAATGVWHELPPLPVNGASASDHHLGIAATLGVAPASVLLTLGIDPHNSVASQVDARDLWLWAWDPVASKWKLGQQAPPDARLVGFSWSAGPVGGPYEQTYGAYLWLSGDSGGRQTLYDTFIPVPAS